MFWENVFISENLWFYICNPFGNYSGFKIILFLFTLLVILTIKMYYFLFNKDHAQSFYCRSNFFLQSLVFYPAKYMNQTYCRLPRYDLGMQRKVKEQLGQSLCIDSWELFESCFTGNFQLAVAIPSD
jgi:hypothetical protein